MFDIKVLPIDSTKRTNNGSFLQTPFWCEFKSRHDWTYKRFFLELTYKGAEESQTLTEEVSVLNRSFASGRFSLAYIPLFPKLPFDINEITPQDQTIEFTNLLHDIAFALKPELPANTIAIRFDPDVAFDTAEERAEYNHGMRIISFADRLGLKTNHVDIQPPDTTLVDLTAGEDEILGRMHQKWRYNIRLAEK
ncbi:MAG: peptidoglycan bridge formation glycyltransferase FemA/FemB family protein, partial [Treponema sp.]|nr:peptidoglycan bridge formation glycyltransferase FemA/FemB family protein [Treponema sp.]